MFQMACDRCGVQLLITLLPQFLINEVLSGGKFLVGRWVGGGGWGTPDPESEGGRGLTLRLPLGSRNPGGGGVVVSPW